MEEAERSREEMLRTLARLKLRLEVCLRRERDAHEYREALASSLADVEAIAHAAAREERVHKIGPRMNELHTVE
jgi:hypothetical protein